MQIKSIIKSSLNELVIDSTSHGLPKIFKSKHFPMKLMWTICFIVSTCYCSYSIFQITCDYFNYDVVTVFETVYETPAKFPVITLCNANLFQTKQSEKIVEDYLSQLKFNPNLSSTLKSLLILNSINQKNETFKKSISYPFEESLIGCEFNTIKCNASDFSWTFHSAFGNCYRFNSGKDSNILKNISFPGSLYGLKLEIFVDPSILSSQDVTKFNGFHVFVNNQTEDPRYIDGLGVSIGMKSDIVINRHYSYQLGEPYNECKSDLNTLKAYDSELYKSIINSNSSYQQMDCFYLCLQKKVINECRCYIKIHNKLSNDPPCENSTQILCSQEVWAKFLKGNFYHNCLRYCPARCDSVSYTLTTANIEYPSRAYFESHLVNNSVIRNKFLNKSFTYEDLKSKVLALNIFYDRMSYTKTSQQPKTTLLDLVSNMGGLLGLFLGISFLSFVEIFEALFEVIYIKFFRTSKIESFS